MKRLSIFCVLIISIVSIFFTACETDFDVGANWKEITVVYGILNPNESNHFVRIQKAFLDEETSALQIAAVNDSLFHKQILNVKLNEKANGNVVATHILNLVNGEDFNIIKEKTEDDIFANSPNLLYHTSTILNVESNYEIVIENLENGNVKAETPLIEEFKVFSPTNAETSPPLNLIGSENQGYKIRWRSDKDAFLYDLILRFFYREITNTEVVSKQFDWKIVRNKQYGIASGAIIEEELSKVDFFNAIVANVGPADIFIDRDIDSVQFHIIAGAEALSEYNETLIAQQTSISAGQSTEPYTNIENGIGLFSSRFNQVVYGLDVNDVTRDSLVCNPLTEELNFLQGSVSTLNCN